MASPAAPGSSAQLTRLSRIVYRRADERLLGMKIKEYVSLIYLRDHMGTSQQALAEALHLDANNCVLLLNELEDLGFAERLRDKRDRRRHIVCLTPRGQSALERAERYMESVEDDVLGALTGEERATLRELLTRALEAQDATTERQSHLAGVTEKADKS
jgi:MarR family transcriptional regulator, temperature-dependent positive regulator of motility